MVIVGSIFSPFADGFVLKLSRLSIRKRRSPALRGGAPTFRRADASNSITFTARRGKRLAADRLNHLTTLLRPNPNAKRFYCIQR